MKLLRAEFQNFRMLRDLKFEFATDPERHLTVIRAANESGKTTILHGLQWALYGDEALPNKGKEFRLHPIDWNASESQHVPITAMVEFELTTHRRISGKVRESHQRYRIVRSALEDVDSNVSRSASTVKLFELKETGTYPISTPESFIKDELPLDLREVFFTDGDRALSFIEADVSVPTRRRRIQQAIRSLLGLEVINAAIKHVQKSAAEVNKKAKQVGGSNELNKVATSLESMKNNQEKLEESLEDAKEQFSAFDEKVNEVDRNLTDSLQKGDKEKLRKDLEQTRREIKQIDNQIKAANKEHSELFRSQSIATGLLAPVLICALETLEKLYDQGKIPNTTIPVLHDRLQLETCICGETLKPDDPNGETRRAHIQNLIDDSHRADQTQKVLTDLYYGTKHLQNSGDTGPRLWLEHYKKVLNQRDQLQTRREEVGRKYRSLEQQIDSLPDTDIQGLRETRRKYIEMRDRYLRKQSSEENQLDNLRRECKKLETKRDCLLRKQKKGARILAEKEVTQDVIGVLKSSYERITNEELQKVSDRMNNIFLEMIGAEPKQGAIIMRTEISKEFDIIVYGSKDRMLNPDQDLNGASRRALTLAFILALTKVSEVKAPNVIDTPLGMTSGFVKQSVLRTAVRESVQLILFLTHDEISGCEDIIDEAAGIVFTLTNPAHYPKMLVNDPRVVERKVLHCDCDHRRECQLCQRRQYAETELNIES